jgi:RNA polymerase sigma factor (sigma-70 family)
MHANVYKRNTDDELIAEYMENQNQACFSELYDRYSSKIFSKCLTMLKEPTQAEDAAQEIFMKIFTRLSSFNHEAKFSTWIYAITYNYCIDEIRRNKKMSNTISADSEKAPDLADRTEMSDAEFLEMDLKKLGKALDKMSVDDRALLVMKYKDGIPIKDLAQITGKTESAIKMRLMRAKEKAREHYQKILLILITILTGLWKN